MSSDELRHHYRIIDMMLSMHSALRDRHARRALAADLLLLFLSLVLNAFVFLDPSILDALQMDREASRIVLGVCAVLVLFLSLVIWRVDWKERSQAHAQAADTLGKLKLDCKGVLEDSSSTADRVRRQAETCRWVLSSLPKIPESDFAQLKAAHRRKIRLSQLLDAFPGTPIWVLGLRLKWGDTWAYLRDKNAKPSGGSDA